MEKNETKIITKGWTKKNFLIGGALLIFGFLIYIANIYIGFLYTGDSEVRITKPLGYLFSTINVVSLILMVFGALGFWLAIPAFQKWWHTRKWITWLFFAISLFGAYLFIYLYCLFMDKSDKGLALFFEIIQYPANCRVGRRTDANGEINATGSLDDLASMLHDFGITSAADFTPLVGDVRSTITTNFANPGTYFLSLKAYDAESTIRRLDKEKLDNRGSASCRGIYPLFFTFLFGTFFSDGSGTFF